MAANAPMLAKRAMEDGDPVGGYLPSGTVAGVIDDRPSCEELVGRQVVVIIQNQLANGIDTIEQEMGQDRHSDLFAGSINARI